MNDNKTAMDMVIESNTTKEVDLQKDKLYEEISDTKTGPNPKRSAYESMRTRLVSTDTIAVKWLIDNRKVLEEMINKYLANKMIENICKPDLLKELNPIFAIELKKDSIYSSTDDSIIIISDKKSDIEKVHEFAINLSEQTNDDFYSIRYLFPQGTTKPVSYSVTDAFYEYKKVVSTIDDYEYSEKDYVLHFDTYLESLRWDISRILYYKSRLSILEKFVLKREIHAIDTLSNWYKNVFCDYD